MADRGTATHVPSAAFTVVTGYDPITRGGGSEPVEPKRFLNVAGVAVPIQ
jgi:hypothetical protein